MKTSPPDDLKALAIFLDAKFPGPFGWRFGWDGLLGLIPGVGDLATNGMAFYVLLRAAQLGATPSILLRMGGNLLIDNLFDAIPIIGNLFDFAWKANLRNLTLLERYLENPRRITFRSRVLVWLIVTVILATVIGMVVLAAYLLSLAFEALF